MAFVSAPTGMPVIDDDNWQQFVDPVVDGEKVARGLIPRDYSTMPRGAIPGAAKPDTIKTLSRPEILEIIEEQERNKSRLIDLCDQAKLPIKHQASIPYCWIFATTRGYEIARLTAGEPMVPLSPASVGGPITGYKARGGYGHEAIGGFLKYGAVPESMWKPTAIDRRLDTPEAKAERMKYKAVAFTELESGNLDQLYTLIALRIPVSLGLDWWGHQILGVALRVNPQTRNIDTIIDNSWGESWGDNGRGVLTPNKSRGDGVAITVATAA